MFKNIVILVLFFVGFLYFIKCSVLSDTNEKLKSKCLKDSEIIDNLRSQIQAQEFEISKYIGALEIIEESDPILVEKALHQVE
jgi:hypothetical protein